MMVRNYFTVVIVTILRYMIFTLSSSVGPNRLGKWFPQNFLHQGISLITVFFAVNGIPD